MDELRRRRLALAISKAEAARMLGVHRNVYARWEAGETAPDELNALKVAAFIERCLASPALNTPAGRRAGPTLARPGLPKRALDALTATLLEYEATFGPSEAHARLTADLRSRVQAGALSLASAERLMSALDWTIAEARGVPPPLPPADHVVAPPPDVRERLTPAMQPVVGELVEAAQRMLDLARAAGWAGVGATAKAPLVGPIRASGGEAALPVDPLGSGPESSADDGRKKSVSGVVPPSDSGFSQIRPVSNSGDTPKSTSGLLPGADTRVKVAPMSFELLAQVAPEADNAPKIKTGHRMTERLRLRLVAAAERTGLDEATIMRSALLLALPPTSEEMKDAPDKG